MVITPPRLFNVLLLKNEFLEKSPNLQPSRHSYSMEHDRSPLPAIPHTAGPAPRALQNPGLARTHTHTHIHVHAHTLDGRRAGLQEWAQKAPRVSLSNRPLIILLDLQDLTWSSSRCYQHRGGWVGALEASAPQAPYLPCRKPFGVIS